MTMARFQRCFKKLGVELGYYSGKEKCPRYLHERNKAL